MRSSLAARRAFHLFPNQPKETHMSKTTRQSLTVATMAAAGLLAALAPQAPAFAQAKEQFIPVLSYRTGPYAPNGIPSAST